MTMMYLYSPKSRSGVRIKEALGLQQIRHENSEFRGSPRKTVINWGSGELPREVKRCTVINPEGAVLSAINKRDTFDILQRAEVSIPAFTTSRAEAQGWLDAGEVVVARTRLEGRDGAGVILVDPAAGARVPEARLYTKYIPKDQEYRIHVVDNAIIDFARKGKLYESTNREWRIRTGGNDFVFVRTNVTLPQEARTEAIRAVRALGLNFGAVDLVTHRTTHAAYVLEVNTAPELDKVAADAYTEALSKYVD